MTLLFVDAWYVVIVLAGAAISLQGLMTGRLGLFAAGASAMLGILLPEASWAPFPS